MRNLVFVVLLILVLPHAASSQENKNPRPTVQDLDFLVGTWEITFEIYDTHAPEKGVIFTEQGTQTCEYDLPLRGVPMFIVCKGEVTSDRGRSRSFQESIHYSRFSKTFERIGIFSNWPAHSFEKVFYHQDERMLVLKGELSVQDGMLERYQDIYRFDETYGSYTRRNVANFSDMPVTEFNLTLAGTGKRIE